MKARMAKQFYGSESKLRSELLQFKRGKNKGRRQDEFVALMSPMNTNKNKQRYSTSSPEPDMHTPKSKKSSGLDSEQMLQLFSPELLVATSNDEINVQDVIKKRLARGVPPTLKNSKNKKNL